MADGTAGGTGNGLSNLFQNKMFLQMLAGLGAGIAGPNSGASALNDIVQQNISSQNFSKILSGILGGGGKMTMDKDKFNVTGPSSLLGNDTVPEGGVQQDMQMMAEGQMTGRMPGQQPSPNLINLPNPFRLAL